MFLYSYYLMIPFLGDDNMNKKLRKIINKNQHRSQFYHKYKRHDKDKVKEEKPKNKFLYSLLNKILISIIILFILLISKKHDKLSFIYDKTFKNMNFMQVKLFIDDKFNGLFPKTSDDYKYVDAVIIDLNNSQNYRESLLVETNYAEPIVSCVDGIVIRMYNDDDLGQVIVIQDSNGYEYHYGYLSDIEVNIYSSIEYGQILGLGRVNEGFNCEYYLAIKDGRENLDVIDVVNNL